MSEMMKRLAGNLGLMLGDVPREGQLGLFVPHPLPEDLEWFLGKYRGLRVVQVFDERQQVLGLVLTFDH